MIKQPSTGKLISRFKLVLTDYVARSPRWVYDLTRSVIGMLDRSIIYWNTRRGRPLTLVYQQGRVASTSVYQALYPIKKARPLYHVHTLSANRADELISLAKRRKQSVPRNLFVGKYIANVMRQRPAGEDWKIISIFRDPIAVMLSLHFMQPKNAFASTAVGGNYSLDDLLEHFTNLFENDDPQDWDVCTWYERIFKEETGVDVYSYPFDKESGYGIIEDENIRLLLIRFEDLSSQFAVATKNWLDLDENVELEHINIHRNRAMDDLHQRVRQELKISPEACERIYSTRFIQHFYSPELIRQLSAKWTHPSSPTTGSR